MALTPEDVINKRFQPTKFREGYDQDEVDDFLDEIVVELRRLNQENTDLKQQLETAGRPVAPRESAPSTEPGPAAAEEPSAGPDAAGTAVSEPAAAEPSAEQPVLAEPSAGESPAGAAQSAAGVLAMAQKLHDEFVAEGAAERDRLVAEARAQAEELVEDAQRTREQTLTALRDEEAALQHRVEGLRGFEQDYRDKLRGFIQDQLHDLETTPALEPAPPADGDEAPAAAARA
ncbi:DivIVA domain-containing protein [Kocuria oceani]|uniref:Cell wall synthesis protein Wag31 n=1 Tax=Kocuria oceani TaxID=988827 RepID=A0ABV9THS0_9MICC|nr:DivIVA domain-containing protein [Kocuria oceani]